MIERLPTTTKPFELDRKSASAFSARCSAYMNISDFDKAIDDCNKAIQLDPKNAGAFASRGTAFARIRDTERALTDFSEAARSIPNMLARFLDRGLTLLGKGDREEPLRISMRRFSSLTKRFHSIETTLSLFYSAALVTRTKGTPIVNEAIREPQHSLGY